ncbi:MAG: PilZ domain-containing protein [Phycisphaeraceae bacterium]|nr:PilZ domain-containing protein [Phycisphaeraceae bacterium]MCB9847421.1 PilZ domain-containing protein [Phycisphaeraceae bacterium]
MNKRFQDTVRLSAAERRKLLDKMDRSSHSGAGADGDSAFEDRRAHRRHTYRPPAVAIQVQHPGGGGARYLVGARNLSQQGVGLIHGGFLYDGAECTVVLETRKKQLLAFPGKIVTCRHVDGTIHELGVRFDREIDIETYFQLVEPVNLAPAPATQRGGQLPDLAGRLLYIDPSVAACDQVKRFLAGQDLDVVTTRHLGAGLDAIRREAFDLVVCEAELDGVAIGEALDKIRSAGHAAPIAIVMNRPDQERDGALTELGVAQIALKPLNKPRLFDLIHRCLHPEASETPGDLESAVFSHMDAMQRRIDALEGSIIRGDIPNLRIVCESIAHASGVEGQGELRDAANDALKTMRESGSSHAAMEAVRRVAELAQSIQRREG